MGLFPDIFTGMAVLLLLAAGVGAIGIRLRQPLIVAFILVITHSADEVVRLEQASAYLVMVPFADAAHSAMRR